MVSETGTIPIRKEPTAEDKLEIAKHDYRAISEAMKEPIRVAKILGYDCETRRDAAVIERTLARIIIGRRNQGIA